MPMRIFAAALAALVLSSNAAIGEPRRPPLRCQEDSCWGPSSIKDARAAIAAAEAELAHGNSRKAAWGIDTIYTANDAVNDAIDLVAAVAGLRSGMYQMRGQNPAKTIRLAYEANPADPKLEALHAEALLRGLFYGTLDTAAARAKRVATALRLLTSLEARKQLSTAHGWAALARAQHLTGAATATANATCVALAVKPAVCAWALAK